MTETTRPSDLVRDTFPDAAGAQAVVVFLVGAWPAILIGAVCGVIYYRVRHPRKKK